MAASKPNKKPNPPLDTNVWSNDPSKLQGSAGLLTPAEQRAALILQIDTNFNKSINAFGVGPGGAIDPGKFVAQGGAIDPSHFKDSPAGQAIGTAFGTLGNEIKDLNTAVRNLSDAGANTSQGIKDISKYLPYIIIGLVVLVLMTVGKNSGVTISK